MKIMGLESATLDGSVAIVDSRGLTVEYSWDIRNAHSEEIFFSIDKALKKAKTSIQEIDGFTISLGPGSFTGIRIGITVTRTLAQVLNKRVVGIPTLDSLAFNLFPTDCLVCPIIDALRNEVYTALYTASKRGLKRLTDHSILNIEDLLDSFLPPYITKFNNIIFLGPAVKLHQGLIKKKLSKEAIIAPSDKIIPRGKKLAELGLQSFLRNEGKRWDEIFPLYIRRAEAEVKWEQKHNKSKKIAYNLLL